MTRSPKFPILSGSSPGYQTALRGARSSVMGSSVMGSSAMGSSVMGSSVIGSSVMRNVVV